MVPRFPLPRFPPLQYGAAFSTPAFSTPANSASPNRVFRMGKIGTSNFVCRLILIVLKMVSQRWGEIDFGCKEGVGRGELFILVLRSTGCDVEGLNTEVGAKNRDGGTASLPPLTLATADE